MNKTAKTLISRFVLILTLLVLASNASALMIEIKNISLSQDQQTGISLGFSLDGSETRDFSTFIEYELDFEEVYTTPHIPEISGSDVHLFSYSLYPSDISVRNLHDQVGPNVSFEAGSNVGLDRVSLKFLIPEPTSLLLLGSGVVGLWFVRKRQDS